MTKRQKEYVDYLREHGETDQATLMGVFNVEQRAASGVLNRLLEERVVTIRFGIPEDRGGKWDGPQDWLWRLPDQPVSRRRSRPSRSLFS